MHACLIGWMGACMHDGMDACYDESSRVYWLSAQILGLDTLGLNPGSALYWRCDFGQLS